MSANDTKNKNMNIFKSEGETDGIKKEKRKMKRENN